jgi:elongation factor P
MEDAAVPGARRGWNPMYETSDIRNGLKVKLDDGNPYTVIWFQFVKPGKGTAFTRTRLRNMINGNVIDRTFKTGEKLEPADLQERQMQYLYKADDKFVFMDTSDYSQLEMAQDQLDQAGFMVEQIVCSILFYNERPIGVTLPNFVEIPVTECEPGVKGDTASGASKTATLATGATIQVPLFVREGDILKIDTRSGEYVERVKG